MLAYKQKFEKSKLELLSKLNELSLTLHKQIDWLSQDKSDLDKERIKEWSRLSDDKKAIRRNTLRGENLVKKYISGDFQCQAQTLIAEN